MYFGFIFTVVIHMNSNVLEVEQRQLQCTFECHHNHIWCKIIAVRMSKVKWRSFEYSLRRHTICLAAFFFYRRRQSPSLLICHRCLQWAQRRRAKAWIRNKYDFHIETFPRPTKNNFEGNHLFFFNAIKNTDDRFIKGRLRISRMAVTRWMSPCLSRMIYSSLRP